MGPRFRSAFVAATTAVLLAGTTTGAGAAGPAGAGGPPPKAGFVGAPDVVGVGWTGPLTVAWLNYDDSQTFRVQVTGPDGYEFATDLPIEEGSSVREPVAVTALPAVGDYTAAFLDAEGTEVFDHDFRAAVPVALEAGEPAPRTFLPRVRDGIRDATHVDFTVDRAATVTGRVVDGQGRVVQTVDLGTREPGTPHRWTWFGRAAGGRAVERGSYSMRLVATADGLDTTQARDTRVASYTVPVKRKVRRLGTQTAVRDTGGCRVGPAGSGALRVDCRRAGQGDGARLTWRFTPGRAAAGVQWLLDRDGAAVMRRTRRGGVLLISAQVRPGTTFTTRQVLVSYGARQQR